MKFSPLSLLALLAMGVAWGLQVSMLKFAVLDGYNEINVMVVTLVLISVIYSCALIVRRQFFSLTAERIRFFIIIAIIGYLIPMAATLYAAKTVPAGILVLLISLSPICTFAAARLLGSEPISRTRVGAMLLGCISVVLILSPNLNTTQSIDIRWVLVALLVPICYGVESVYVDIKWPKGLGVLQVGMAEAVAASLLTLPLLFLFGEVSDLSLSWGMTELAIAVFVMCGVLEVFLYFYLIKVTGGVLVSFATFISLFAGIAWGAVIFDEIIGTGAWAAVFVLVLALTLVSLDAWRRRTYNTNTS